MPAVSADTAEGEFRVPEDVEAEQAAEAGLRTEDPGDATETVPTARRRLRRTRDGSTDRPLADVDISTTPGPVVGAVALGVVAAPLLGVYAVLFVTRYFLQPGVSPDLTSSWTGEGICGVVAAVLAVAMLVVVARAAGGRGLPVFVVAQALVLATCGYLLSDSANGGRSVTIVVGLLALAAIILAVVPVSRRWFAAHAADRAERD